MREFATLPGEFAVSPREFAISPREFAIFPVGATGSAQSMIGVSAQNRPDLAENAPIW